MKTQHIEPWKLQKAEKGGNQIKKIVDKLKIYALRADCDITSAQHIQSHRLQKGCPHATPHIKNSRCDIVCSGGMF